MRGTPADVAALVRSGQVRKLRGIGRSIEARLKELVQTGGIGELAELERELSPDLIGLGRYLGLSAQRVVDIARALNVRTADELRKAIAAGRLQEAPGVGPTTEAKVLARQGAPRPRQGLRLNQAWELTHAIAAALDGEPAGDARRWCDSCEHLAVVCAVTDPGPVLDRFAQLAAVVAVLERSERGAVGLTVEGVPIELVVAEPSAFGTELVRATGSTAYVRALGELPVGPEARQAVLGKRWRPPELREAPGTAMSRRPHRAVRHPRRSAHAHHLVGRPGERGGDGPRSDGARLPLHRHLRPHPGGRRGARADRR